MSEKHKQDTAFAALAYKALYGLMGWDKLMGADKEFDELQVREIRVKSPSEARGEFMVIVKARVEGRLIVGFHSASSFDEAIRGAYERVLNNGMKWKDDVPYGG